ncbi:MAG TPA: hypothetical protein VGE52_11410 [Pirellulales bacterium]
MAKKLFRVVTRGEQGELQTSDYAHVEDLLQVRNQVGIDDCSTDLNLRGLPIFRELIGPMPEGKTVVRYESPDVFEELTKEWCLPKAARPRRRTARPAAVTEEAE